MTDRETTWPMRPIGDLLKRVSRPVDVQPDATYREIGIRSHCKGIFHKPEATGKKIGNKRVFWIEPGCLVFNIIFAWEQAVAMTSDAESGMIASHRFPMYQSRNGKLLPEYAWRYFSTPRGKYDLNIASPGGAGRNKTLGQEEFKRLKIPVPPVEHQRRALDILSTVDRAMERTGRFIEAKRKLKKGLAQQLLTGQRRLAGFGKPAKRRRDGRVDMPNTPPAGWEYARLEQIASFKSGGTPSKDRPDYWGGDVPWVSARDLGPHRLQKTGLTVTTAGAKAGSSIVETGAIFILVRGMTLMKDVPIGVACCPMAFNQDIRAVIPRKGINRDYLAHFMAFAAPHLRRFVTIAGHGTGRLEIDSVRAMQVALPPDDEQDRIAEALGAADREIALLEKKLAALSELKRGLMQTLLSDPTQRAKEGVAADA